MTLFRTSKFIFSRERSDRVIINLRVNEKHFSFRERHFFFNRGNLLNIRSSSGKSIVVSIITYGVVLESKLADWKVYGVLESVTFQGK